MIAGEIPEVTMNVKNLAVPDLPIRRESGGQLVQMLGVILMKRCDPIMTVNQIDFSVPEIGEKLVRHIEDKCHVVRRVFPLPAEPRSNKVL